MFDACTKRTHNHFSSHSTIFPSYCLTVMIEIESIILVMLITHVYFYSITLDYSTLNYSIAFHYFCLKLFYSSALFLLKPSNNKLKN